MKQSSAAHSIALGILALLPACVGDTAKPPPAAVTPVAAAAPPELSGNICPVLRFLVGGKPAEAQGYDVLNALSLLQQGLKEKGYEVLVRRELINDFQNRRMPQWTPLHESDRSARATSADMETYVARKYLNSLQSSVRKLGGPKAGNCDWILTGEVKVLDPVTDQQSGWHKSYAEARLIIVEGFGDRALGSTLNQAFGPRQEDRRAAVDKAMSYGLEGTVESIASQIEQKRNIYELTITGGTRTLERADVQEMFRTEGFQTFGRPRDENGERIVELRIEREPDGVESAIAMVMRKVSARYPNADYSVKGHTIVLMLGS